MPDLAPGAPTSTPVLDQRLVAIARRLRVQHGLDAGARAALALAPFGVFVALGRALAPGSPFRALDAVEVALLICVPVLALFLGASLILALGRSLARVSAARWLEGRVDLGVPFTTALELEASHAWSALVALEAERAAATIVPAAVAPIVFPLALKRALAVVAVALACLALPPREVQAPSSSDAPVALTPAAIDTVSRAATRLRLATGSLPAGPARRRLEEAGLTLQDLVHEVEAGKVGQREALDRLATASDAVRLERDAAQGRRTARQALERTGALDPLAAAASGHGAPDERTVRSLATALTRDPKARESARAALRAAQDALTQDPTAAAALDRAQQALDAVRPGESPPPDLAPALDAAARALAATPGPERDAQAAGELARAAEELDRARQSLTSGSAATPATPGEPKSPVAGNPPVATPSPEPVALASPTPGGATPTTGATPAPSGQTPPSAGATPAPSDKTTPTTGPTPAPAAPTPTTSPDAKPPAEAPSPRPEEAEGKLPLEAIAELAKLLPPDLLAQALKLGAKLKQNVPTPDVTPPKISPDQAEKLLERLPPETLKKLAQAMSDVAKDMPPPAADSKQQAPPMDPETAQRLAKKLPPDVLESLANAARDAQQGREPPPGAQGPGTQTAGTRTQGNPTTGQPTPGTPKPGETATAGVDPDARPVGTGADEGPSAPATTKGPGTGATPGASPVSKPGSGVTKASPETDSVGNPKPDAGVSGPGPEGGRLTDDDGAAPRKLRVAWGTAPESLPANERDALRSALDTKRVPPSYERAVREYFDLQNK